MHDHVRAMFERAGLAYAPPPEVVPNTRNALRLGEHAREQGRHQAFHDRVMDAYWAESVDVGDQEQLRRLAEETDAEGADDVLASDLHLERVLGSTQQAVSIGVNGVPAFLLDRRLLVLGAQPREVFEGAFDQLV